MPPFFAMRASLALIDTLDATSIEASVAKTSGFPATTRIDRCGDAALVLVSTGEPGATGPWRVGTGGEQLTFDRVTSDSWHPGPDVLSGSFAFVLGDPATATLVAARDRRGLESLVLLRRDDLVAVASDMETMLASRLVERRVDWTALRLYLRSGYVPEPLSLVAGLSVFPVGSCLTVSDGGVRTAALEAAGIVSDPGMLLRDWCAEGGVALLGTRSACNGVRALERLLAENGCKASLYSIDGSGNGRAPFRQVPVPRGEDAVLKLLGKALNSAGHPSVAAVEATLLADTASADGMTSLLSAAGGAEASVRAESGFARLIEGLWARGTAAPAIFTAPEIPGLMGPIPVDVVARVDDAVVPDPDARHRANFRTEQDAARGAGARIFAPFLEAGEPSSTNGLAAIDTALPIAPLLEGSLRTIARELVLGLGQDAILMSSSVSDLWRALRTMPRSVDASKIWCLVALGAWTRKLRVTA